MSMTVRIVTNILIWMLILLLSSASSVFGAARVSLIPAKSSVFLDVDYSLARKYPDLCKAFTLEENLARIRHLRVDPKAISGFTIFAEVHSNSSEKEYVGAIFETNVDLDNFWKGINPRGQVLNLQGTEDCICILGSRIFVMGTREPLLDILKLQTTQKAKLIDSEKNRIVITKLLTKKSPVSLFISLPQEVVDMGRVGMEATKFLLHVANLGVIGHILAKIGLVESFGMSFTQKGTFFPVELLCLMENEGSAGFISGALNLLKTVAISLPPDKMSEQDKLARESFKNMYFSREKELLVVAMSIPVQEFMNKRD
jgi:hypothetical protein